MTLTSVSIADGSGRHDASIPPERRSDTRVQTVFRVARVIAAADEGLARVRNMSDQGARLRMLMPLALSDSLTLEFADGWALSGQVVWKLGDEFGLQFDQPINCADLLAVLAAGTRCGSTRPVRLAVLTTALTRSERGLRCAKVADISQRGLKLVHNGSMSVGLQLKITLPSGLERRGIVRWTKNDMAGVMLLEPLSVEALGSAQSLIRPVAPELWLPQTPDQAVQS